jgi:DNA-binding CsgD family transcriptional regulator
MSVPFVGRRPELDALALIARRGRYSGLPAAALVTGEPGTGKTRLLAEILADQKAASLIKIVGFEPNAPVPLAAVGEVLRRLSAVPGHGQSLEALAFGGRDQGREPLRIFEAAHRALSSFGPLLIAVDDLQWVDDQSLGLLHYLLRAAEASRQPLSVIAAGRPSSSSSAFRATVEGCLPDERRAVIELGPLPLADGLSLARAIDHRLDEVTASELWRRARGSPFWLEALARSSGAVDPSRLIGDRLGALGREAGALLALLAIGARPLLVDEIAELLSWDHDRVRHASRELVAQGLGVEISGTIRVAHDLIRDAATESLPASARLRLHGRLADWIEAAAGDDPKLLREALDHRIAAGLPTAALAARLLSSPGRRLLNGGDLRLIGSISDALDPSADRRISLDRALAELAAIIGEQELALERWARVSDNAADPIERQHAETEAGRAAYVLGRSSEAHRHLDRAREASTASAEATIRLDALLADVELWLDHQTALGSRTAARALAGAETLADKAGGLDRLSPDGRRAYLVALEAACDGAMQEARADDVIRLSEMVIRVAEGLDEESHVAALARAGFTLRTFGMVRESAMHFRRAWDVARRLVLPTLMIEAGRGTARGLRDMGHLAEARAVAAETCELEVRVTNAPRRWGNAASILHAIELSLGEPGAALRALLHDAEAEPDPHYLIAIHETIAEWLARYGGAKEATKVESALEAAHGASSRARCPRCAAELSILSAELLARIGRVEAARRELAVWDQQSKEGHVHRDVLRMFATAAIAHAEGDERAAVAILESCAESLENLGRLEDLFWVRLDLGRAFEQFDRQLAIAAYTTAADLADRMGALSQGRLASQALRRLGVRAWRRGPAGDGDGLGTLSGREREIAGLVASGSSNREIAEALLVSPKTVERHITNTLAKLGIRNRTELASFVGSRAVRGFPDE